MSCHPYATAGARILRRDREKPCSRNETATKLELMAAAAAVAGARAGGLPSSYSETKYLYGPRDEINSKV